MKVATSNTFATARFDGAPFPLGFSVKTRIPGLVETQLFPTALSDLSDLVGFVSLPTVLVFNVLQSVPGVGQTLADCANDLGIPAVSCGPGTIALSSKDLVRLAGGPVKWAHFHAMDLAETPTEASLAALGFLRREDRLLIPPDFSSIKPADSSFQIYSSEGICSFQTRTGGLPKSLFRRMLALYCGALVAERDGTEADIEEAPLGIADEFFAFPPVLTFPRKDAKIVAGRVQMGFSEREYDFRKAQDYPLAGWVEYALPARSWRIIRAS
jgi:hypothetical protein